MTVVNRYTTCKASQRFLTGNTVQCSIKGSYLDFSHLTELKTIYRSITYIYMREKKNANH